MCPSLMWLYKDEVASGQNGFQIKQEVQEALPNRLCNLMLPYSIRVSLAPLFFPGLSAAMLLDQLHFLPLLVRAESLPFAKIALKCQIIKYI